VRSAHHGPESSDEIARADGVGDEIVGGNRFSNRIEDALPSGEHHKIRVGHRSELAAGLKGIEARNREIKDHEVGVVVERQTEGVVDGAGHVDNELFSAQILREAPNGWPAVINHQGSQAPSTGNRRCGEEFGWAGQAGLLR
jgi:hypothetical protein